MWDDGKHISLNVIPYTVNSCLRDTLLLWMLATTDKVQTPAKAIGVWLEMTPTITDSCYYRITDTFLVQSDNFIGQVWLSIKRTCCTSHITLLCKITVYCSSFAKIHFRRFPECLFSHWFLELSAQSSSLLHLSLPFFLPSSLGELKSSRSILNSCLAVAVLLISSSSLGRYFGYAHLTHI